jgi:hypothetical protein
MGVTRHRHRSDVDRSAGVDSSCGDHIGQLVLPSRDGPALPSRNLGSPPSIGAAGQQAPLFEVLGHISPAENAYCFHATTLAETVRMADPSLLWTWGGSRIID